MARSVRLGNVPFRCLGYCAWRGSIAPKIASYMLRPRSQNTLYSSWPPRPKTAEGFCSTTTDTLLVLSSLRQAAPLCVSIYCGPFLLNIHGHPVCPVVTSFTSLVAPAASSLHICWDASPFVVSFTRSVRPGGLIWTSFGLCPTGYARPCLGS